LVDTYRHTRAARELAIASGGTEPHSCVDTFVDLGFGRMTSC
jgi:hypothetical protein